MVLAQAVGARDRFHGAATIFRRLRPCLLGSVPNTGASRLRFDGTGRLPSAGEARSGGC